MVPTYRQARMRTVTSSDHRSLISVISESRQDVKRIVFMDSITISLARVLFLLI